MDQLIYDVIGKDRYFRTVFKALSKGLRTPALTQDLECSNIPSMVENHLSLLSSSFIDCVVGKDLTVLQTTRGIPTHSLTIENGSVCTVAVNKNSNTIFASSCLHGLEHSYAVQVRAQLRFKTTGHKFACEPHIAECELNISVDELYPEDTTLLFTGNFEVFTSVTPSTSNLEGMSN